MAKKLYIIDGHAHIYAAYYAPMRQRLASPAGEPTKATYIFTAAVLGLIQRHKPDMLASLQVTVDVNHSRLAATPFDVKGKKLICSITGVPVREMR